MRDAKVTHSVHSGRSSCVHILSLAWPWRRMATGVDANQACWSAGPGGVRSHTSFPPTPHQASRKRGTHTLDPEEEERQASGDLKLGQHKQFFSGLFCNYGALTFSQALEACFCMFAVMNGQADIGQLRKVTLKHSSAKAWDNTADSRL